MSKYWCVLQTYLWRPRFWVLGFFYLLFVWSFLLWETPWDHSQQARGQVVASAIFGCLAGSFLALHVRRQFSNEPAIAIPGYAQPHLVVAVIVSLFLWVAVPGLAIATGWWPTGALALHACAALLTALVALWPRALLLLAAMPVLLIWQSQSLPRGQTPRLTQLIEGDLPVLGGTMLVVALVANLAAGCWMLRLPRRGVNTNDEFTPDAARTAQDTNPFSRWLLSGRDAAADRLLDVRLLASVQRWRVPVAISPTQLMIPPAVVAIALLVGLSTGEWRGWMVAATMITCAVLILVPLGPLHVRRHLMGQEMLRPVTRASYFRQIVLALAMDMVVWMGVASALIVVSTSAVATWEGTRPTDTAVALVVGLGTLWSMATFVFGVGLATMRWPLWLPIVAGISMFWFFGVWLILMLSGVSSPGGPRNLSGEIAVFIALNAIVGLLLATWTYGRWVRSDVA